MSVSCIIQGTQSQCSVTTWVDGVEGVGGEKLQDGGHTCIPVVDYADICKNHHNIVKVPKVAPALTMQRNTALLEKWITTAIPLLLYSNSYFYKVFIVIFHVNVASYFLYFCS